MKAVAQHPSKNKIASSSAAFQRIRQPRAARNSLLDESPFLAAQRRQIGSAFGSAIQRQEAPPQGTQPQSKNQTGLPDPLKSGVESLSGISLDNVQVHYNSDKPSQLNALAYAQGANIHVAPGQEKHLPHEAWHIVQQAHGRVQPTRQMKTGTPINDDRGLEREADVMGERALAVTRLPAGADVDSQLQPDRGVYGRQPGASYQRFAHPLHWITQLEKYPEDSTGSFDEVMATIEDGQGGTRELTGGQIQKEILKLVMGFGKNEGGFRIGSYALRPKGSGSSVSREGDGPSRLFRMGNGFVEDHGMPLLEPKAKPEDLGAIDQLVKVFVIGIMKQAKQLQYIDHNADQIFATHYVVVDVDCQFNRMQNGVGFHKDSRGTTAFVNLTFSNEEEMQGTDYYEDLEGDTGLESNLPAEVKKDIGRRRERRQSIARLAPKKHIIESTRLPKFGRMSFSDPNLYHSTPLFGHRESIAGKNAKDIFLGLIQIGYKVSFLKSVSEDVQKQLYFAYYNLYNWHSFEQSSQFKPEEGTHMLAKSTAAAKRERRLSTNLRSGKITQKQLDEESKKTRTFIRTWVRFVRK